MFDKHLVDAFIGGKDLDPGSVQWSVSMFAVKLSLNLVSPRGHGSPLVDLYFRCLTYIAAPPSKLNPATKTTTLAAMFFIPLSFQSEIFRPTLLSPALIAWNGPALLCQYG